MGSHRSISPVSLVDELLEHRRKMWTTFFLNKLGYCSSSLNIYVL